MVPDRGVKQHSHHIFHSFNHDESGHLHPVLPYPEEQLALDEVGLPCTREKCFDHGAYFEDHHHGTPVANNNCPGGLCVKVMTPISKLQPHNIQQTVQNVLQNSKMAGLVKDEGMKVTAKIGASKKEETPASQQIISLDNFSKKGNYYIKRMCLICYEKTLGKKPLMAIFLVYIAKVYFSGF